MAQKTVPVLDLAKWTEGSTEQKSQFVAELGDAFHEIGFIAIKNHGIPMSLIEDFYSSSKSFFALEKPTKTKYEIPGLAGQRGYTSFGKEHAKGSKVADLKEFFQIGQQVEDTHPDKERYPDNVQVSEVPQFPKLGFDLYKSFEKVGTILLKAIAIHLDLAEGYFDGQVHEGSSILRAIHYPPITQEPNSAIRAEQHEDINLITLLVGASAGGLQLLNKDNEWLDIEPEEDEIVINVDTFLFTSCSEYGLNMFRSLY